LSFFFPVPSKEERNVNLASTTQPQQLVTHLSDIKHSDSVSLVQSVIIEQKPQSLTTSDSFIPNNPEIQDKTLLTSEPIKLEAFLSRIILLLYDEFHSYCLWSQQRQRLSTERSLCLLQGVNDERYDMTN
jgi:hypothetical protein